MKALKPLQYQAAILLAEGHSVSTAASELRIHRSTIHLWLKRPDFNTLIEAETCQAMAALRGQTQCHQQEMLQRTALAAKAAREKPMCRAAQKNKARESERFRAPLSKSVEFPHKPGLVPVFPTSL